MGKSCKLGFFYFVLLQLFFVACNDVNVTNTIIEAESIVSDNPNSSLVILQYIKQPELLKDSTKANYWLALGQAHYNSNKSMQRDSLLAYAFDYYNTLKDKNYIRLFQSYKLFAQHLWWKDEKEKCKNLLKEGLEQAVSLNDTVSCIHLLKSLCNNSQKDNELSDAILYTKQLIDLDKGYSGMYEYYNDLGILFYYTQEKDSSLHYLEKSVSLAVNSQNDPEFRDILIRNYADVLSDFGENDQAIVLQKQLLKQYKKTRSKYESLAYISLSRYYLNKNRLDSAKYYMELAEVTRLPFINEDLSLNNYYTVQKTVLDYAETHKFKIRDLTFFSNNMFESYLDKEKIIREEGETQELLEKRNLMLLVSKHQHQVIFLSILFLFILSIIVILFYVNKKKKQLEEKEEEIDTLKYLFNQAKEETSKDDKFFKRILLQQLGLIKLVATNPTSQNQDFLLQMSRITNKDIPVDSLLVWNDLYDVIDSIYNGFYSKLTAKYADVLIDKEIQLCCLLKANFSTKEISVVSQQGVRTVYQRKTTIRQKLNMQEKEDIIEFLDQEVG